MVFITLLHLPVNHLHHLQKLLLDDYSFLHKQLGGGFLLDDLRHEESFKGNDLFRVKAVPFVFTVLVYHKP